MKGIFAFCLISSLIFSSCAWFEVEREETAQELIDKGMGEFNDANYRASIPVFEKLRDWYPFSKYAILAELKIADAYYRLTQYEDAIYAYKEFESLHPRNEATPYVVNQIGLSYFGRVDSVDRDQVSAEESLHTFQRLVKQFPDSIYANNAKESIRKCQKSLAGNELEIGLFYFKKKHYKAALHRFKNVLTDYPDVGEIHHQALQFIALCEKSLSAQPVEKK
jgi:outer membrane protein assembly factor BamD